MVNNDGVSTQYQLSDNRFEFKTDNKSCFDVSKE